MYEQRFYRDWMECEDLNRFQVVIDTSDLFILCENRIAKESAKRALREARCAIERYIDMHPIFLNSLVPISVEADAPQIVQTMAEAAESWGVGPMAAVAGAIAELVGKRVGRGGGDVIVENGGDVWARANRRLTFAMYAGEDSPFKDKIAFTVEAKEGVGVCTSSGKVGPSLSFGSADAVVAIAADAAFADAAATSIANCVRKREDVDVVIEETKNRGDLIGVIACLGDRLGIWGDIEIVGK